MWCTECTLPVTKNVTGERDRDFGLVADACEVRQGLRDKGERTGTGVAGVPAKGGWSPGARGLRLVPAGVQEGDGISAGGSPGVRPWPSPGATTSVGRAGVPTDCTRTRQTATSLPAASVPEGGRPADTCCHRQGPCLSVRPRWTRPSGARAFPCGLEAKEQPTLLTRKNKKFLIWHASCLKGGKA